MRCDIFEADGYQAGISSFNGSIGRWMRKPCADKVALFFVSWRQRRGMPMPECENGVIGYRVVEFFVVASALFAFSGCLGGEGIPQTEVNAALDTIYALSKGDYEGAYSRFDSNLRASLTTRDLASMWTGVTNRLGQFQKIPVFKGESHETSNNSVSTIVVICAFERGKMRFEIGVTKEGQITHFSTVE